MPEEIFAPKLSRLTTSMALDQARELLTTCFWPLDVRYEKVVHIIDQLRFGNGTEAARWFVRLDAQCQFFVRFSLEIYGLQLAMQQV